MDYPRADNIPAAQENWWQGADLNRRPKAYESSALPLSYPAETGRET